MNTMESGFDLLPSRLASFLSSEGERVGVFLQGEFWTALVHINECELVSSYLHNSFKMGKNCNMRLICDYLKCTVCFGIVLS